MGIWLKEGKYLIFEIGKWLIDKTCLKKAIKLPDSKIKDTSQRGNVNSVLSSLLSSEAAKGIFIVGLCIFITYRLY